MDRGTVDCTVNYTVFVKSYKHYEVAKHLMLAGMGQSIGYGGAINLKFYNNLPQDLRNILDKASDRYMDNYGKNLIEYSKTAAKEMSAGIDGKVLNFVEMPQAELDRWAEYAKPIGAALLGKMKHMSEAERAEFADSFKAAVAKYRKIKAEKGYPWER